MKKATAWAPATTANVNVGFDILGYSLASVGDLITVEWDENTSGRDEIILKTLNNHTSISDQVLKNTASVSLLSMKNDLKLSGTFYLSIEKGIPVSAGLGGSAASAVGSVVALNALLEQPLTKTQLLKYALDGEQAVSGGRHKDNVVPCLMGGFNLVVPGVQPNQEDSIHPLPTPEGLASLLFTPDVAIKTSESRDQLNDNLPLKDHTKQLACSMLFMAGLYENNHEKLRNSLQDIIIEPQRGPTIPLYFEIKDYCLNQNGVVGFGISGSGSSVFIWLKNEKQLISRISEEILTMFEQNKIKTQHRLCEFDNEGAKIIGMS
ncbi:MAG: homoserine kinase [Bdellovibrionaceae bacterium]|jgi:homoserine kinase|nr:homoserine kinase [Pseudobdellovibrionaceae bacterium]